MATLTTFLKLLKPEKNDYVDVEKHISENYDKIDTEFLKIDTKFKNYCPISIGSIDVRYDNKNPAELYPGTTWELISQDKYIKSGNTALQQGGNNSVNIGKEHLPNIALKVNTFSLTTSSHAHSYKRYVGYASGDAGNAPVTQDGNGPQTRYTWDNTNLAGGENTGSASPYTENLGSGTPLNIQPEFITLKFWKRLT